jgi:H+-translocating NAD(P) transhydrogenase subunit alpha
VGTPRDHRRPGGAVRATNLSVAPAGAFHGETDERREATVADPRVRILVQRERGEGERRVAATPDTVKALLALGATVTVETAAGEAAGLTDAAYIAAGAEVAAGPDATGADVVLRVGPPSIEEVRALPRGCVLVGFTAPHRQPELIDALMAGGISSLAMELVPRISRAQSMDALSSQANLSGYRAVLTAAAEVDKYFPLLMTAAGTVRPAEIVILGAGVAGLQALATARRLGAVVHVSDIREAAREEVASLGGRFIELPQAGDQADAGGYAKELGEELLVRQREVLTERLRRAHVAITTAQIPLRPAPLLITRPMVEAMPRGAIVIDLAAADGGNCELTDPNGIVEHGGVRIVPGSMLANSMPGEASALYARNVAALTKLFVREGAVHLDLDDEVIAGTLMTHDGSVVHPRVAALRPTTGQSTGGDA